MQSKKILALAVLALTTTAVNAGSPSDNAALDPTFGATGKVSLANPLPMFSADYTSSAFIAQSVAVQADGKTVLAGYTDVTYDANPYTGWVVSRISGDGSIDTGFGAYRALGPPMAGYQVPFLGSSGNRAVAVAVRPDGHIVVAGNILDSNDGLHKAVVIQFDSAGNRDMTFGNNGAGATYLTPAPGDAIYASRMVLQADGSIDVVGTYYDNLGGFNGNQFFFDRISADGSNSNPFQYEFGSGANQDDHALDMAIDNQGRYVVVGYHRGPGGNYDCAAIRIRADLHDIDTTFGSGGQTTVAFDKGGDNGDFCNAVAIFANSQYIVIGGHASVDASGNQNAIVAMLDNNGQLDQYFSDQIGYPAKFAFTYGGAADAATTVNKLIVDDNDTKSPQLLAIGSGFLTGVPNGDQFGIARINLPGFSNFSLDTTFNGSGTRAVFFTECLNGFGLLRTTNAGLAAAYVNGKLTVVGNTSCASGGSTNIAVTRLAPFDVIYDNGFDTPSY